MKIIKSQDQSNLDKKVKEKQDIGEYQDTLIYLTKRKIIQRLSMGPLTFAQIQKETKADKETLGKILGKFAEEGCVYKHELARAVLEHQQGQPQYYILNFEDNQAKEFLSGLYPDSIKMILEEATKPKKSISEYKKNRLKLYGLADNYKLSKTSEEKTPIDARADLNTGPIRDPRYYQLMDKAYRDERVRIYLKEICELQEDIVSTERYLKKPRIEYEENLETDCLSITSNLIGKFSLTIWDALIVCADTIGPSNSEYLRVWNLFHSDYPDEFVFK